jgi:Major Facilitator Superfamily
MVAAGTLMSAVQYPLLAEVHGVGPALYWLIVVSAVSDTVYWPTYHAYFAALGDDEHRGQQIGAREAIAAIVGVVSPLVTGWLLVAFGPRVAFGTTAVVLLLAALPFLRTPDVKVVPQSIGSLRAALPGALLFAADGWIAASYVFVWQIALFLSLGESLLGFGGALAVAALVGAVGGLLLGRHIDRGHGKRAVWYAFGPLAVIVVLRALAVGNALFAVIANALGSLTGCLYTPTLMTAVYTQGKHAPCDSTSLPKVAGTSAAPADFSSPRCSAHSARRCGSASCRRFWVSPVWPRCCGAITATLLGRKRSALSDTRRLTASRSYTRCLLGKEARKVTPSGLLEEVGQRSRRYRHEKQCDGGEGE